MIAALLLAAAAATVPDVFIGDDGCRWIRKPLPARRILIQWKKPPAAAPAASAPASAASAPKKHRKTKPAAPKRDALPAGFERDCSDVAPPTPFASIIPPPAPFSPVPDDFFPPLSADAGPGLPAEVPLRDLPPAEVLAGAPGDAPPSAWSPGWGPVVLIGPVLVPLPPVAVTPAIPEPGAWAMLLACGGLVLWRSRRRQSHRYGLPAMRLRDPRPRDEGRGPAPAPGEDVRERSPLRDR